MKTDLKMLVEQYGIKISRLSHKMIQNCDLAKEAAQEVWFEIIRSINDYRGDSDISTWIYIIAKRTILRYAKSERVYRSNEIQDHFELEPIVYSGAGDEKKQWVKEKCDYCLTAFCHCLNNESRMIFLFHHIAGLQYSEISQIMELREDNVRQIISRSTQKVRNFMDKNCILFNPDGKCKCRIRRQLIEVDLDKEYRKIFKAANLINFYQKFDKDLPRKNYWEKIISEDVTK